MIEIARREWNDLPRDRDRRALDPRVKKLISILGAIESWARETIENREGTVRFFMTREYAEAILDSIKAVEKMGGEE